MHVKLFDGLILVT